MMLLLIVPIVTVGAAWIGFALDSRWLLPVITALPGYATLVVTLRAGHRGRAVGLMIWWALWLGLTMVLLTMSRPDQAEGLILHGSAYRDEMFRWLATGAGREQTPALFIPQHMMHAAAFCVLALVTGGALAILMGAALMNYMSFYVGQVILACAGTPSHGIAVLLAWNPWSMIRVASFIVLGVVLAEPLLRRITGKGPATGRRGRWLAAAGGGLLIDILLKALLAPLWPDLLSGCFGPGGVGSG